MNDTPDVGQTIFMLLALRSFGPMSKVTISLYPSAVPSHELKRISVIRKHSVVVSRAPPDWQPLASLTVTEYAPAHKSVICAVVWSVVSVSEVLQLYVYGAVPPSIVTVTEPSHEPLHVGLANAIFEIDMDSVFVYSAHDDTRH